MGVAVISTASCHGSKVTIRPGRMIDVLPEEKQVMKSVMNVAFFGFTSVLLYADNYVDHMAFIKFSNLQFCLDLFNLIATGFGTQKGGRNRQGSRPYRIYHIVFAARSGQSSS